MLKSAATALAVLVMVGLVVAWTSALAARWIESRALDRRARVHNLSRLLAGLVASASLVACGVLALTGMVGHIVDQVEAPPARLAALLTAFIAAYLVLAACAYVGVAPSLRRLRRLEKTPGEGVGTFARSLALGIVPVLVYALGLGWVVATVRNQWLAALARGLLFAGILVVAPLLLRFSLRSYPLDTARRKHLMALCARENVRVRDIRQYRAKRQKAANAMFVGILPARRYIFVSDYLLHHFPRDEVDAVVAHEIGHGKEHHLLIRAALFTVALMVSNLPGGSLVGLAMFLYLIFGLGFRFERRADDFGARVVGATTMANALRHLAALNDTPLRTGRLWNRLGQHPGVAERILRLDAPELTDKPGPATAAIPGLAWRWRLAIPAGYATMFVISLAADNGTAPDYPLPLSLLVLAALTGAAVAVIAGLLGRLWAPAWAAIAALLALPAAAFDVSKGQNPVELLAFSLMAVIEATCWWANQRPTD